MQTHFTPANAAEWLLKSQPLKQLGTQSRWLWKYSRKVCETIPVRFGNDSHIAGKN